jgi:hypothetical protein
MRLPPVFLRNQIGVNLVLECLQFLDCAVVRTSNHTIHREIQNALRLFPERNMARMIANDLKTRSVAAIEALLADGRTEAVVSLRGTARDVVMGIDQSQHLRECAL